MRRIAEPRECTPLAALYAGFLLDIALLAPKPFLDLRRRILREFCGNWQALKCGSRGGFVRRALSSEYKCSVALVVVDMLLSCYESLLLIHAEVSLAD